MRLVFIGSISVLIIALLFWTRPDSYAELQDLPPPTVNLDQVSQLDIQPVVQITGKLQPARSASIHFQVSGQINARQIEAGQYVEMNSVLLSIEEGDFIDAVEESKALLKTEQSAIERDSKLLDLMAQERELQEQEVERLKRLGKESLSSKSNYDQALQKLYQQQAEEARLKHSVDSARSRLMVEQARLNKAQRNLERTKLIAPFAGTINSVHVEIGDYVSPGEPAIEIVQIDSLDLNLEVTGIAASQLHLGQKIKVDAHNDEREGEIIALAVEPDPQTNTHALKVRMPSASLFAGQLAVAHLPGQLYKAANVVPISSVLYEDGQSYVFELIGEKISRKPVTLIERYNDVHIIEGIAPGTRIVSKDVSSLADGQTVVVR